MKIILLSVILIFVPLTSCNSVFMRLYGIKKIRYVTEKDIIGQAQKMGIDTGRIFVLKNSQPDSGNSKNIMITNNNNNNNKTCVYDPTQFRHNQPLQALYFNSKGALISFHNNCYTGGFPNLKWNRNNVFNFFPPKSQIPVDTVFNIKNVLRNVYYINGGQSKLTNIDSSDFYIVIFWNIFMYRQSRRLIMVVNDNLKLADKKSKISIYYINDDNYFYSVDNK